MRHPVGRNLLLTPSSPFLRWWHAGCPHLVSEVSGGPWPCAREASSSGRAFHFAIALVFSTAAVLIGAGSALLVGACFRTPKLGPVLLLLSLIFAVRGLGVVAESLLRLLKPLTSLLADVAATEEICRPLPFALEEGVEHAALWLRGVRRSFGAGLNR